MVWGGEASSHRFTQALIDYTGLVSAESRRFGFYEARPDETKPISMRDFYDLFVIPSFGGGDGKSGNIMVRGTAVHLEMDPGSSSILVRSSADEELAKLDFVGWIKGRDLSNLPIDERTEQILDPADLTFEVDLGDLGSVKLMARRLLFHRNREGWLLRNGDFWVLVPAE